MLAVVAPSLLPFNNLVAQAATIELNKKECTLEIGETTILKLSGTTKTITWTSSDKTVAVVSKKRVSNCEKSRNSNDNSNSE